MRSYSTPKPQEPQIAIAIWGNACQERAERARAVALAKQCRHVRLQGVGQMTTGNARRDTEWEQQRSKLCVFRPVSKDTMWQGKMHFGSTPILHCDK